MIRDARARRHAVAGGLVAALLLLTCAAAAAAQPLIAAHRGGALLWPENSLLAFRNALALVRASHLEIDHLALDNATVAAARGAGLPLAAWT